MTNHPSTGANPLDQFLAERECERRSRLKYYQVTATREEYLAALAKPTYSIEEILKVFAYLRDSVIVRTYLYGHIGKEMFGRPVLSNEELILVRDRPADSTQAYFDELAVDALEEWLNGMDAVVFNDAARTFHDPQVNSQLLMELATRHMRVFTEYFSFDAEPPSPEHMRGTIQVFFDLGSLVVQI